MGTSTRPPGPRTGLVTPKCYAAALGDCDGRPTTREHYVSESLLNRLGAKFFVEGLPWLDGPRELTASMMVARVLCKRHNSALSPLDTMIGNLYDVLASAREGREVGVNLFEGEDLERWARVGRAAPPVDKLTENRQKLAEGCRSAIAALKAGHRGEKRVMDARKTWLPLL